MATLIIRFTIFSADTNTAVLLKSYIEDLPSDYKKKSESIGDVSIDYQYSYENIYDLNECNSMFLTSWQPKALILDKLKENGFKLHLNYEFTVSDFDFPELYFQPDLLFFFGKQKIELSFYNYQT